jgi:hypothetical protein
METTAWAGQRTNKPGRIILPMPSSNVAFCIENCPRIAEQLRRLPRSSRDRRLIEEQIRGLSHASLIAADRLFGFWTKGGIWRDNGNRRS